jgi:DNA-directed RNA polymerase subunit H (RpoH/RPB5)
MDTYLSRIPKVIEHLIILLKDRGYIPPLLPSTQHEILKLALERNCSIGEILTFRTRHVTDSKKTLVVSFLDPLFDSTKNKEMMTSGYQIHGAIDEHLHSGDSGLLIVYGKLSPDASKEAIKLRKRNVQVIVHTSLLFPLSKHVMVKRHVALSEDQAKEWEIKHKIHRKQLPFIKFNDPVRIWYNWPKSTIVEIERGAFRVVN